MALKDFVACINVFEFPLLFDLDYTREKFLYAIAQYQAILNGKSKDETSTLLSLFSSNFCSKSLTFFISLKKRNLLYQLRINVLNAFIIHQIVCSSTGSFKLQNRILVPKVDVQQESGSAMQRVVEIAVACLVRSFKRIIKTKFLGRLFVIFFTA